MRAGRQHSLQEVHPNCDWAGSVGEAQVASESELSVEGKDSIECMVREYVHGESIV
jgi:hypothetical protein